MEELRQDAPELVPDKRPGLAMIANTAAPYRVNLHRLIAAGIPELKLHTLITHGDAEFCWSGEIPRSIHLSHFGGADDSPLSSTWRAPIREWRKGGRLINYLRENDIRAVITVGHRYISYLRTIRYAHRMNVPLFVWNDSNIRGDTNLSLWKRLAKRSLYTWWLGRVAGVMPVGEYGKQFFEKYGAHRDSMYEVPCTPDYSQFAKVDEQRLNRFRERFGLSEQRKYLLYSGRLVPVKRVDLLIGAFGQIALQRPEWDLLVAGDGRLAETLRNSVPESLQGRIVWTGFLEQAELINAYHSSEVLVLPSDREPWAVVVQEAMAAGLAVIASDVVGAAAEIIGGGLGGRIFAAGDQAGLQKAMLEVTDPAAIARIREESSAALAAWRQRIDPVAEIRRALSDHGVLRTLNSSHSEAAASNAKL